MFTELECPVPVISHGAVNKNKTVLGDEITVTCDSGYEINGSASLRCNVNQTFGTNIPFCQGMVNPNAKFDLIQHQDLITVVYDTLQCVESMYIQASLDYLGSVRWQH